MKKNQKVLFAGGKTGGHLFPGIAVATLLRKRGWRILFVGSKGGLEESVLQQHAFPLKLIPVGGLKGKSLFQTIYNLLRLVPALILSLYIVASQKIGLVVSLGGYAAGPVALAGFLLRREVVALEQNSIPGITSRLVGKFADRIYLSFPDEKGFFSASKAKLSGNPVRPDLLSAQSMKIATDKKVLAVFGGSQGARSVNNVILRLMKEYPDISENFHILHQTGSADYEKSVSFYRENSFDVTVEPFFQNIGGCYLAADVVVCRAGATTIAELSALNIPAIYLPFPHAADNHQYYNARYLVAEGAALMVDDTQPMQQKVDKLYKAITDMVNKKESYKKALNKMAEGSDATTVIANDIEQIMR